MCAQFRTGLAQSVRITQATPRRHREADARHRWVGGWRCRGFGTAASGSDTGAAAEAPAGCAAGTARSVGRACGARVLDRASRATGPHSRVTTSPKSMPAMRACTASRHSYAGVIRLADCYFPISFLPAAEDAGLMRPLAARVLDMALTQLRSWRDDGVMVTVAVNLSTTNLLDLGLVASIARLLRTHDLPPESLILEITESTLTTDSQRARNTVAALRRLGTRLSLDDYGTGWSSLARLQDLSVDEMKLDQVFVARLALDPRSFAIVRSTVALAHSLGADLVAEGVEDDATLRALRKYGCNITQGNVHSPPLPAAEIQRWLAARCPTPR